MFKKWKICCAVLFISIGLNGQNITAIKVISVPLYTTSTFRISCSQFDQSFIEMKKEFTPKEPQKLREAKVVLSTFKSKNLTGIDVRGKVIIYYCKKKNKVICFDEFGHFFTDGAFFENKNLFNFLLSNNFIEY